MTLREFLENVQCQGIVQVRVWSELCEQYVADRELCPVVMRKYGDLFVSFIYPSLEVPGVLFIELLYKG